MIKMSTYNKGDNYIMENKIESKSETGSKKYCKFLSNVYDGRRLMFNMGNEYLVTAELDECYYLGEFIENGKTFTKGISKKDENIKYTVISK